MLYLDPEYAGEDTERYPWLRDRDNRNVAVTNVSLPESVALRLHHPS